MPNQDIFFWGATGQAIVLEEFLVLQGYSLLCSYDRNPNLASPFESVPVFHERGALLKFLGERKVGFAVAIGGAQGGERIKIHGELVSLGHFPITAIHSTAAIASNVMIGEGNQILINSTVGARVVTGKQVIINSSSSIDHECVLADGVHIGPGASLAGCVEVGECSFVGTGATVLPRIRIGKNSIIGAGSVVTRNIGDNMIAYGNPCREIRVNNK